jgi:transcriptional regulator of acetoin/glycerol metabolism
MLDLTGIDAVERPELKHLVTQSASKIENALVLAQPHALTVRLSWPGNPMGSDADGLLCLDADGWITGANRIAREMVPNLAKLARRRCTSRGVWHHRRPAVRRRGAATAAGVTVVGPPAAAGTTDARSHETGAAGGGPRLRARGLAAEGHGSGDDPQGGARRQGNVMEAARALGISRATVYRKLGQKKPD